MFANKVLPKMKTEGTITVPNFTTDGPVTLDVMKPAWRKLYRNNVLQALFLGFIAGFSTMVAIWLLTSNLGK